MITFSEKAAAVHFRNLKVYGYDQAGKPLCKPSIKFPGFIKVAEGEIEVAKPLHSEDDLKIEFNLKHNSLMIGTVCQDGKSKNNFVPDEVWCVTLVCILIICSLDLFSNFEVCKAAPDFCKILSTPITLTSADLPEGYSGLIPLSPLGLSVIEVSVPCRFWSFIGLISRVSGKPVL